MQPRLQDSPARLIAYVLASALAMLTYFYALDSQYAPRNGDEDPYTHITRLTAESGAWLPLQSTLDGMRNTKPPLLFWQGIASTHGGKAWTLWNLRYPSVLYTLATALLVFALAAKLSQRMETGFIALLTFLAFFTTYRFGRPFLVNPAEVFWFFLPFFTLLYWQPASFASRMWVPVLIGVEIGVGLLYKSFALVAPIGLGLACWYWHQREYRVLELLRLDAWKVALSGSIALLVFASWFALDPDPQAVWREFVIGENAGKFGSQAGYWSTLLWGGNSVWVMVLGYPFNAGLLAFPITALFIVAWRQRAQLSDAEKKLWLWLLILLIVFSVPSQRSTRYLLEAMPCLAVLCALSWERIGRAAFIATLAASGLVLALLAFLAVHLQQELGAQAPYAPWFWLLIGASALLIVVGVVMPRWTRAVVSPAALSVFLCLAAFLRPFDGPLGTYEPLLVRELKGEQVWVPCNFRAKDETFRFILPGAQVHGYAEDAALTAEVLAQQYRLFAWRIPLGTILDCEQCTVLGKRYVIRSRHGSDEIKAMLQGQVLQHLFAKELLLESPAMTAAHAPDAIIDGCR